MLYIPIDLPPLFRWSDSFECEEHQLTQYIQKQASQDARKKLAICFVAADSEKNVSSDRYKTNNLNYRTTTTGIKPSVDLNFRAF